MFPWPGVLHACYRNSRVQTGVVASMLMAHRYLNTWEKQVNAYIVFTDFYRQKFTDAGLPPKKISIKPHFVCPDPGQGQTTQHYALFVGRLAAEKGVVTLIEAWERSKSVPLKIRGTVLCRIEFRSMRVFLTPVSELVPRLTRKDLVVLIQGARFLIWPSEGYYETFGLVAVEAFACGTPVVASRIGVMEEIVEEGRTGLLFTPGDAQDLAAKMEWAWSNPEAMKEMGRAARREYEAKYTAETNYQILMHIYEQARAERAKIMSVFSNLQGGILKWIKPIHLKYRSQKTELLLESFGESIRIRACWTSAEDQAWTANSSASIPTFQR